MEYVIRLTIKIAIVFYDPAILWSNFQTFGMNNDGWKLNILTYVSLISGSYYPAVRSYFLIDSKRNLKPDNLRCDL